MKPSDPSSSSTAQKGLNAYFMPTAENGRILNQSEPVIDNSQIMKDSRNQTRGSKVLIKLEPKTFKSKVLKQSKLEVVYLNFLEVQKSKFKTYPRQRVNGQKVWNESKP